MQLITPFLITLASSTAHAELPPKCLELLVGEQAHTSNPESLLVAVKSSPQTSIALPYARPKSYKASLVKLDTSLAGVNTVYLSYADRVEILDTLVNLDRSFHLLIKHIDGFHFTLGFDNEAVRKKFLAKIHYKSIISDGVIDIDGKPEFTVPLTPEQFVNAQELLRKEARDSHLQKSDKAELESLSDSSSTAHANGRNKTTYYFKGNEPIGFAKDRRYYRYISSKPIESTLINYASHYNILKRQRGDQEVPKDLNEQLRLGTQLLDRTLITIRNLSKRSQESRERDEYALKRDIATFSVALRTINYPWLGSLPQMAASIAATNLRMLKADLETIQTNTGLVVAGVQSFSNDLKPLQSGPPDSKRLARFLWIKNADLQRSGLLYENSDLLHEQMLQIVFGKHLAENTDFLSKYIRGGVLGITYGPDGKPSDAKLVVGEISLLAGVYRFSDEEQQLFETQLLNKLKGN